MVGKSLLHKVRPERRKGWAMGMPGGGEFQLRTQAHLALLRSSGEASVAGEELSEEESTRWAQRGSRARPFRAEHTTRRTSWLLLEEMGRLWKLLVRGVTGSDIRFPLRQGTGWEQGDQLRGHRGGCFGP